MASNEEDLTPPKETPSLAERLSSSLPKDIPFTFYHLSTAPTRSPALYSAPPGAKPERTYTESQFLAVSITPPASSSQDLYGDKEEEKAEKEVLVLAIEILIYTTRHLTTIFVSKADSTGYLSLLHLGKDHASPLRTITSTFLSFLIETRRRKGKKLVLSLFARANDQYLFPGSVENSGKHVSDDRQLIKWWCRVVDPILRAYPASSSSASISSTDPAPDPFTSSTSGEREKETTTTSQAYLIIPGEDSITPFLPPSVRLSPTLRSRWTNTHPLPSLSRHPTAPPRCLIPHFPDDPKARFLDELDDELPDNNTSSQSQTDGGGGGVHDSPRKKGRGRWKSVRSLEQFWEMMAFRQECSSGRLVGFLWVVFSPAEESISVVEGQERIGVESQASIAESVNSPLKSKTRSTPSPSPSHSKRVRPQTVITRKKKPLRGPIIPRTPKIKRAIPTTSSPPSSNKSKTNVLPTSTPYYLWPPSSRGTLLLPPSAYKKATDRLLTLQFKNLATTVSSTRAWIEEVGLLGGRSGGNVTKRWGFRVVGRKEAACISVAAANVDVGVGVGVDGGAEAPAAPMMMVKKKKRKADDAVGEPEPESGVSEPAAAATANGSGVNMLGAGLVKKKKKVQPVQV